MDRKKVIKGLECCLTLDSPCGDCPYYSYEDIQELDCERNLRHDALALLKKQELPTELKQKMWNALYAIEDEYEKQFVGTDEHDTWFNIFRPWLQKGFDIAIKVIADWEGR